MNRQDDNQDNTPQDVAVPAGSGVSPQADGGTGISEAVVAAAAENEGGSLTGGTVGGSGAGAEPPAGYTYAGRSNYDGDDDDDDDSEKSSSFIPADFWGHVEALRWVIVKSVAVFMVAMLLMMFFSVYAQKLLTWPLQYGMALAGVEGQTMELRTDGPFSVFTFMLQLWVFGGLLLSLPFVVYFSAGFIAPGLTAKEKGLLRPVAVSAIGLFVVGCLFAFFLLLPTYMAVSLSLEKMFGFASLWTPGNYYGAVVWTTLGLGFVFEFPLVLILLQYLGLVRSDTLRLYRRHAFVFILIFAALLTPGGDPITLAVAALPLYLLFEAAILIGGRLSRNRVAADVLED